MKTWLRLTIVTMTVGGGFSGMALTSQFFLHPTGYQAQSAMMASLFALYAFVFVSGLLLVQNPQKTRLLIVALALQIPCILSPIIVYRFASGASVVLGVGTVEGTSGFKLDASAGLGSNLEFNLMQGHRWSIGINFVALAILVLLLRSVRTPAPVLQSSISVPAEATSTAGSSE